MTRNENMGERKTVQEILSQMNADRELIAKELPELRERDARMQDAAAEGTLCGHLRRAIHQSRRPLADIARQAGISSIVLCDFLEGARTLQSDVLDRLTQAAAIDISLTPR